MNLSEDHLTFRQKTARSNPYRMILWAILILAALWLFIQVENGQVAPFFEATPTPTRTALSLAEEGQARFEAGNLDKAIEVYQEALANDQKNVKLQADLARIQTYSAALLTTDQEKFQRLQDALASINQAVQRAPDDSYAHAVRAFVLDWNAGSNLVSAEDRARLLNEAEVEAVLARDLDRQNTLALVYYAEVLLDQQKWNQARQMIESALKQDSTLMDAYRVHGLVLETLGLYNSAIKAYEKAAQISPNLTFLYLYIGYNYRKLEVYNRALEYFDRAATINNKLGIQDPLPYIAIAKTYAQQGEFFVAARNGEKALELDPQNPDTYGRLGIIYVQSRNYEGALPVLKCAVYGCSPDENEAANRLLGQGVSVTGLPLTSLEVAYYYLQYGSVLAALNECDQAEPVLNEVMAAFGADPVVESIVAEDREICRILQGGP